MASGRWKLKTVKTIAAQPGGLSLSQTRAIDFFPSHREANEVAAKVIADLKERDFSHTVTQLDVADVYGVKIKDGGWYLKLTMSDETVIVISLHPLERELRTNGGLVKP